MSSKMNFRTLSRVVLLIAALEILSISGFKRYHNHDEHIYYGEPSYAEERAINKREGISDEEAMHTPSRERFQYGNSDNYKRQAIQEVESEPHALRSAIDEVKFTQGYGHERFTRSLAKGKKRESKKKVVIEDLAKAPVALGTDPKTPPKSGHERKKREGKKNVTIEDLAKAVVAAPKKSISKRDTSAAEAADPSAAKANDKTVAAKADSKTPASPTKKVEAPSKVAVAKPSIKRQKVKSKHSKAHRGKREAPETTTASADVPTTMIPTENAAPKTKRDIIDAIELPNPESPQITAPATTESNEKDNVTTESVNVSGSGDSKNKRDANGKFFLILSSLIFHFKFQIK